METIKPLPAKALRPECNVTQFKFKTTADLKDYKDILGQKRAIDAIQFGINIKDTGYNIFAVGPIGIGKRTIINHYLHKVAKKEATPDDWCYVNNLDDEKTPIAIQLPPGQAAEFKYELQRLAHFQTDPEEVDVIFEQLKQKYRNNEKIIHYLQTSQNHFTQHPGSDFANLCCQVNVIVNNEKQHGTPVVYLKNPTYQNLFGTIGHSLQSGALSPDFKLIQAGALHHANGGYLLIDAEKLIEHKEVWEALKRALHAHEVAIESEASELHYCRTMIIHPQSIPLNLKIILLGSHELYFSLCDNDQKFLSYFKVLVDFNQHIPITNENYQIYARFIATLARHENLRPLHKLAVTQVINYGHRYIEDNENLSVHIGSMKDIMVEANYWAGLAKHDVIKAIDINKAVENKRFRENRIQEQIRDDIKRKILLIATRGKKVGQINGLTVIQAGSHSFGHPVKISAVTRIGRGGEVINIEREIDMSDPIHAKGVLILTGFLRNRYAKRQPLSLSAYLTFEQTYDFIEGDSASAAELCVLITTLAEVPIRQSLAITGSINQFGQIQAVSGVNDKIEGFYDICKMKGLSGNQGVIIPMANVQNLMLRQDIVAAARAKKFHIYPVKNIDEALTLLTDIKAGERSRSGLYPRGTINYMAERRLQIYAQEIVEEKTGE